MVDKIRGTETMLAAWNKGYHEVKEFYKKLRSIKEKMKLN